MTTTTPTYDSYRPSGINWLGDVPTHWEVKKLKYSVQLNTNETEIDKARFWVALENIESQTGRYIQTETAEFDGLGNTFDKGDVLFNKLRPYLAKAYLAETKGVAVGELLVLSPMKQHWNSKYLHYRILSANFIDVVNSSTYGSKMPRANWSFIGNLKLPIPPLAEQAAIASYLDRQTARIDTLLAKKEELIRLLTARRQALINEAVTGQHSRSPKRPSGIAWLGDIPAHWEIKKLKYVTQLIVGGGTPNTDTAAFWNGNIPWVSPKDMKSDVIEDTQDYVTEIAVKSSSTVLLPESSVLVVVRSGILKHTFPVAVNAIPVTLNQDMKAFIPNQLILSEYLSLLLKGLQNQILAYCSKIGATVDSIETSWLYNFELPLPSLDEQRRIIEIVHRMRNQADSATTKLRDQIDTLRAYRASVITEAVTGKRRVA